MIRLLLFWATIQTSDNDLTPHWGPDHSAMSTKMCTLLLFFKFFSFVAFYPLSQGWYQIFRKIDSMWTSTRRFIDQSGENILINILHVWFEWGLFFNIDGYWFNMFWWETLWRVRTEGELVRKSWQRRGRLHARLLSNYPARFILRFGQSSWQKISPYFWQNEYSCAQLALKRMIYLIYPHLLFFSCYEKEICDFSKLIGLIQHQHSGFKICLNWIRVSSIYIWWNGSSQKFTFLCHRLLNRLITQSRQRSEQIKKFSAVRLVSQFKCYASNMNIVVFLKVLHRE